MSSNKGLSVSKFLIARVLLLGFIYVMVYAERFSDEDRSIAVDPRFTQVDQRNDARIDISNLPVILEETDGEDVGFIQYTVKAGDSLSRIAAQFGTTVGHLQDINFLPPNEPIKPGQKLVISDEHEGIIYQVREKIAVGIFADKYGLDKNDLMSLNYIEDETELLFPGQEIFVNSSRENAYQVGLLERPKPKPKPVVVAKPKPVMRPATTNNSIRDVLRNEPLQATEPTTADDSISSDSKIIAKRTYNKDISNRFYRGHCTRYAAIITPEIFPYIDENTQDRPFGGNANQRYQNAQDAGLEVGQTPRAGALIVYQKWGRYFSYAGHVGRVMKYYPDEGRMVIRDMNYAGKFIVTERREETTNSNIIGYIYPPTPS